MALRPVVVADNFGAVETIIAEQGRRDPNMPSELYERIKRRLIAGWGGYPLIGTPAQIVEQLTALAKTGLDGIVLSWVNYRDEMRQIYEARDRVELEHADLDADPALADRLF
jgi:alkanesulfonate monooxygenase SsuD/methylene tetrahydromethanopterin reductase-like flavin-dependent oxidoreductase (luciferase family)